MRDLAARPYAALASGAQWGPSDVPGLAATIHENGNATRYGRLAVPFVPGIGFSFHVHLRLDSNPSVAGGVFGNYATIWGSGSTLFRWTGSWANFSVDNSGTQSNSQNASVNYGADQRWHTWTGTYDGAFVRLYRDGAEVASGAYTLAPNASPSAMLIGSYSAGGGESYAISGAIGPLLFHGRALSAAEVAELNAESRRGYPTLLRRPRNVASFYAPPPTFQTCWRRRRPVLTAGIC